MGKENILNNLEKLIPTSEEIRDSLNQNEIYIKEMKKEINYLNEKIKKAKDKGLSNVCFCVNTKYEEDLKKLYTNKGYSFKPTGNIGGVWQNTEEICW